MLFVEQSLQITFNSQFTADIEDGLETQSPNPIVIRIYDHHYKTIVKRQYLPKQ